MSAEQRTSTLPSKYGAPALELDPITGLRELGTGTTYPLLLGTADFLVGSGADVSVNVPHKYVSRQHCTIARRAQRLLVHNLSRNGTLVDGVVQADFERVQGETFTIGETTLMAVTDAALALEPQLRLLLGRDAHELIDRVIGCGLRGDSFAILGEVNSGRAEIPPLLHAMSMRRKRALLMPATTDEFTHASSTLCGGIVLEVDVAPNLRREAPRLATQLPQMIDARVTAIYGCGESARQLDDRFGLRLGDNRTVTIPSMRSRGDEAAEVLASLLKARTPSLTLSDVGVANLASLTAYRWPRNLDEVREAEHRIAALIIENGNVRAAAKRLEIHHSTLQQWIARLHLAFHDR